MDSFVASTIIVALAEIGDKTQLLAVVLAARFLKPVPIIAGIFVATVSNHLLAALVGSEVAGLLDSPLFRNAVALSFLAMAIWIMVPDKLDEEMRTPSGLGAFLTTVIAFFFVEMGDKTQVATVALAANYREILHVTMGTTLGMMLANVPAVFLGHEIITRLPMRLVRLVAASLFLALGVWMLLDTQGFLAASSFRPVPVLG